MKKILTLLLTVLVINANGQDTTKTKNLASEMDRLKVETVLIVNSQAIDEYPLWSPNSNSIACNIQGKWYKFRLTNIELGDAQWRGQTIGVISTKKAYSELTDKEQKEFEAVSKFNAREVTTKDKTKIELRANGMSISLILTKDGGSEKILWTSGGENCHSLILSPNEKYVAYLCELNGLLVMKIK